MYFDEKKAAVFFLVAIALALALALADINKNPKKMGVPSPGSLPSLKLSRDR